MITNTKVYHFNEIINNYIYNSNCIDFTMICEFFFFCMCVYESEDTFSKAKYNTILIHQY